MIVPTSLRYDAAVSVHLADDVLRRMTIFRRLSVSDRARIGEVSRLVTFERGDHVFAEGDPADAFLAIVEGRIKVFKSTPAGKEFILEIFGPGDPLGAVAVYEDLAYPASATALDHSTCLRIPRRDFFALLEQHPALVRGLLSGLTIRLAELTRLTGNFAAPSAVSGSVRRLFEELRTFCAQLSAHLLEENDVLFPRALELDRRL